MLKSMTGFGKATKEFEKRTVTVEIRSLNSKGMDLSFRLSNTYREYELELRSEITRLLERGKVDLTVYVESKAIETPVEINSDLAKEYHKKIKQLAAELNEPATDALYQVLKMPDVLRSERREADENEWKEIKTVITAAIESLNKFRSEEGRSIEKDFTEHLEIIKTSLDKIIELDKSRIAGIKDRIKGNLTEVIGADKIDANRFEQELIYYIEKLDINEEKVRLKTHLDYFLTTMKEPSGGRKLNFIAQEIGREINTIGSKANHAEMQKLVVLMKDELEKIKEQTSNVL
ncbi:MAG TPA: YicC/YloC family endoribonuclease [Bacteroidia bacterium]|nr:YicC/YloC family endoribonuclease [Bacteroidia bacterium]